MAQKCFIYFWQKNSCFSCLVAISNVLSNFDFCRYGLGIGFRIYNPPNSEIIQNQQNQICPYHFVPIIVPLQQLFKQRYIYNICSFSDPGGLRASSLKAPGSDIHMMLTWTHSALKPPGVKNCLDILLWVLWKLGKRCKSKWWLCFLKPFLKGNILQTGKGG